MLLRRGVHAGRRFVQEKDPGPADDGPGDENPLLLAPGEPADGPVAVLVHADQGQGRPHGVFLAPPRQAPGRAQGHGHDLPGRGREKGIEMRGLLGDVADLRPVLEFGGRLSEQDDAAPVGLEKAEDELDQGRLARPIGTEHRQEIALPDGKGDILQHEPEAVGEGQSLNSDEDVRISGIPGHFSDSPGWFP